MKFSEDSAAGIYRLHSYGQGWIQVNERRLERGFILSTDQLISDWEPETFTDLRPGHLDAVFALKAELILIGTGGQQQLPAADIYRTLIHSQTGFELMATAAACRTYNVLVAESRRVAVILFPV